VTEPVKIANFIRTKTSEDKGRFGLDLKDPIIRAGASLLLERRSHVVECGICENLMWEEESDHCMADNCLETTCQTCKGVAICYLCDDHFCRDCRSAELACRAAKHNAPLARNALCGVELPDEDSNSGS
jgi:hypothetical protein